MNRLYNYMLAIALVAGAIFVTPLPTQAQTMWPCTIEITGETEQPRSWVCPNQTTPRAAHTYAVRFANQDSDVTRIARTDMSHNACGCPIVGTGQTSTHNEGTYWINPNAGVATSFFTAKLYSYVQGWFTCGECTMVSQKTVYGCAQNPYYAGTPCEDGTESFSGDPADCTVSPIIIDMGDDKVHLTSIADGVHFDLNNDGKAYKTAWTKENSNDAFLVLHDHGDGKITNGSELFGDASGKPSRWAGGEWNGFEALKVWDQNLDGQITQADPVWGGMLALWYDRNKNGISDAGELVSMRESGIESISLNYKETPKVDSDGNEFRWRTKVRLTNGKVVKAFDVYLKSNSESGFTIPPKHLENPAHENSELPVSRAREGL